MPKCGHRVHRGGSLKGEIRGEQGKIRVQRRNNLANGASRRFGVSGGSHIKGEVVLALLLVIE